MRVPCLFVSGDLIGRTVLGFLSALLNQEPPPHTHPHPITPQYYLAEMASDSETDVLVSEPDFLSALQELVPSVSASEMEHYALVQQKFAKDTINSSVPSEPQDQDRKGKGRATLDDEES